MVAVASIVTCGAAAALGYPLSGAIALGVKNGALTAGVGYATGPKGSNPNAIEPIVGSEGKGYQKTVNATPEPIELGPTKGLNKGFTQPSHNQDIDISVEVELNPNNSLYPFSHSSITPQFRSFSDNAQPAIESDFNLFNQPWVPPVLSSEQIINEYIYKPKLRAIPAIPVINNSLSNSKQEKVDASKQKAKKIKKVPKPEPQVSPPVEPPVVTNQRRPLTEEERKIALNSVVIEAAIVGSIVHVAIDIGESVVYFVMEGTVHSAKAAIKEMAGEVGEAVSHPWSLVKNIYHSTVGAMNQSVENYIEAIQKRDVKALGKAAVPVVSVAMNAVLAGQVAKLAVGVVKTIPKVTSKIQKSVPVKVLEKPIVPKKNILEVEKNSGKRKQNKGQKNKVETVKAEKLTPAPVVFEKPIVEFAPPRTVLYSFGDNAPSFQIPSASNLNKTEKINPLASGGKGPAVVTPEVPNSAVFKEPYTHLCP